MSLFADSNSKLTDDLTVGTAQLGGGLAGLGAGYLARIPMDLHYENKLLQEGYRQNRRKNLDKIDWTRLINLANGTITLEDLPEDKRDYYSKLFKEHEKDLEYLTKNPQKAKEAFKEFDRGKVVPLFPGKTKVKINHLFPQFGSIDPDKLELLNDQSNTRLKLHRNPHPRGKMVQATLGLAGFLGSGALMKEHLSKRKEKEE